MIRLARKKHYFIVGMILVSFLFTFVVPAFAAEKGDGQGNGNGSQNIEAPAPEPPANGRPEGFTPPGQEKKNPDVQIPSSPESPSVSPGDGSNEGSGGGQSDSSAVQAAPSSRPGASGADGASGNPGHNEGVGQDPEQSNKVTAAMVPIEKLVVQTYRSDQTTVVYPPTRVGGGDGDRWPAVPVGGYVDYRITVTNNSGRALSDVEVWDNPPPHTEYVSSTPALSSQGPGDKLNWIIDLPEAMGSQVVINLRLHILNKAPKVRTNEAKSEFGSSAVCQVAIMEEEGPPPEKEFDLSIDKSVDKDKAAPGDTLTYTINYSNTGNQELTGVVITDPVPDKTEFVGIVQGTGTFSDGKVAFTIGDLAVGASGTVKFQVKIKAGAEGTINNVATIDSDQAGPKSDDANTEISTTPGITTTPPQELKYNIFLLKVVSHETAKPGDILVYALHWANTGNSTLTNVVLADAIPAGTTYVPDSATTDDRAKLNFEGGVLVWRFDKIDPNTSGIYIFNVRINDDTRGVVENTAIIDSDQTDPERSTARTTVVTVAPAVFGPPTAPVLVAAPPAPKKAAALPFTGANLVVYFLTAVFMIGTGVGLQKLK